MTIIGLIFDILGVTVLLANELILRRIDLYRSQGITKDQINELTPEQKKEYKGIYINPKAHELGKKHNPAKAIRLSRCGLILLIIGFVFQLLGTVI